VEKLNGKNNSKILGSAYVKGGTGEHWQSIFISSARTILRMLWLLDFVAIFFALIDE